jgi:hypothetical protein
MHSGNLFAKRYELHYQPKTVSTPDGDQIAQCRFLNFHAKRDGGPKLSLTIKNKWSSGWTRSWFYCRVPCRWCSRGGKSLYTLHLRMSELDYAVEPEVECPDNDPNDDAFVRVNVTIGGRDAVEEYTMCKIFPLAASFGFESVPLWMTPILKVETPLPLFAVGTIAREHANHFLVEIETQTEKVLQSFGPREYDALRVANIPNGGRLNHVFEQMGVSYFPHPEPGFVASQSANRKQKAEVVKKPAAKKVKAGTGQASLSRVVPHLPRVGPTKKVGVLKISQSKARPGPRGTTTIELALVKPVEVSKKFCLLDVAASSQAHTAGATMNCTARVPTFDNLGDDSSLDVHEAPSPGTTMEKPAPHRLRCLVSFCASASRFLP